MPVFQSGFGQAPAWCELEYFEILSLLPGGSRELLWRGRKEKLFAGEGNCTIMIAGRKRRLVEGQHIDLPSPVGYLHITTADQPTILVRIAGRWGEETGGCGVFTLEPGTVSRNTGDPVDYPRTIDFDVHYHDCDEYWIIFAGQGTVMTEGRHYTVGPGACVATGMGHHHDFVRVEEPVRGVYFETTLEGKKRLGHLWDHTHGPAQPRWERV